MTFKKYIFFALILSLYSINSISSQQQKAEINPGKNTSEFTEEKDLKIIDEAENPMENTETADTDLGIFTIWDFIRMLLILAFVILCIYGLFFLLKKAGSQKYDENDLVNIVSTKQLAANKLLQIVEIGNHVIVVGVSDNNISMITEITDKETIDRIRLFKGEFKKPGENSFYNYLLNTFFRGKESTERTGTVNNENISSEFLKKQRDRIEKM